MLLPLPFFSQYECRSETLEVYASDRRGNIEYKFNNLGYRSDIDYVEDADNVGVYIGSSITSAIGIPMQQSFATISANELNSKCYQFGQGCMMVDNQEILRMLKAILASNLKPKYFVIQFINSNRRYDFNTGKMSTVPNKDENIRVFLNTFDEINQILQHTTWCFIGLDSEMYAPGDRIIEHPCCVSWNTKLIDLAGVGEHPGPKWHKMISAGIVNRLQKQLK
jgi:hypothetical protein